MNFLALILGLMVERLLTHLFHLREFHWLDPLFDQAFARIGNLSSYAARVLVGLLALLLVLPVALFEAALSDRLLHIPGFVFAVIVLLFCLGPRDLVEEVDDYRAAITRGDQDELNALATELLECNQDSAAGPPDIEAAVYAQANNRIFGVVFWFIVLGAAGAWLFRVLDLLRRRAICRAGVTSLDAAPAYLQAALLLHRVLAWVPARLLMIGYALAGSYDSAVQAWRELRPIGTQVFPGPDDELLGAVGRGAASPRDPGDARARARVAIDLVTRTLWMIWCPALALLTLYDWIN